MEITVGELVRILSKCNSDMPVYFGGLDFYRINDTDGVVHFEFNQSLYKDDDGKIILSDNFPEE